jgi:hypothetical protein
VLNDSNVWINDNVFITGGQVKPIAVLFKGLSEVT